MSASVQSSPAPAGRFSRRTRNIILAVIGIFVIAGVVGGGYGLWYVLIGPGGPASVASGPPAIPAGANIAAPASFDGTWNVNTSLGTLADGTASFAGYQVQEQLVGVGGHTAVGRTPKISGSMTLAGTVVSNVQITADLTALTSDNDNRDNQLRQQAIQTDTFPTATFQTTQPLDLGTLPADGTTVHVNASGSFTLHGVTKTVTIAMQALRKGGIIAVTGTLPIVFADYNVQKPNSFSVLTVDDHGTMEFHLLFTHA
jgi:polyisoprenoid-binding protein YceI